ncbi:MAG: hypothetical protein JSV50_00530 [Desulfobacteraceae bacterium]|nr:MAG: hypothetical protein JSV50_00530 [Desulfobacteraceae bacterium]
MKIQYLLEGAYDIHVHASPDVVPRAMDVIQIAKAALEQRMAGVLVKDHTTSTTGRVYMLNHLLKGSCRFFSSLALNAPVGFVNLTAVESALRSGTDIIYFPTYGAQNHIKKWGLGKPPTAFPVSRDDKTGFSLLDEKGKIKYDINDVLRLIATYDAVLGTGHLSSVESLELIKYAKKAGVKRIVVTHASESVVDMNPDQQKEAANMGAMIEHCFFAVTDICPGKIKLESIRDQVRNIGLSSSILSTDFGQVKNVSPIEGFSYYLEKMRGLGFSEDELRVMIHDNPKKLIEKGRKSPLKCTISKIM